MNIRQVDLRGASQIVTSGHSSKGNQPKWFSNGKWYKADHMGYEALAEVIISRFLQRSNISHFVRYTPVLLIVGNKPIPGCESANFRKKNEQLIPIERLHRAYQGDGLAKTIAKMENTREKIRYTVDFIERVTQVKDVGPYMTTLLELDAFFLNEDRHTNNLAVIRNSETAKFRLCPIFDNGLSLLSDLSDYPRDAELYTAIERVRAKPFDLDFDEQVSAAEQLFGQQLKLELNAIDIVKELSTLHELYDETILRRVEDVIREQMRKYGYLLG